MDKYEINVALKNEHWFRVELPGTDKANAQMKAAQLRALYEQSWPGLYHVTMTVWRSGGEAVDF